MSTTDDRTAVRIFLRYLWTTGSRRLIPPAREGQGLVGPLRLLRYRREECCGVTRRKHCLTGRRGQQRLHLSHELRAGLGQLETPKGSPRQKYLI